MILGALLLPTVVQMPIKFVQEANASKPAAQQAQVVHNPLIAVILGHYAPIVCVLLPQ